MFKNLKKTLIIAEAGVNHNSKLSNAFKLVDAAKNCGADYIKFQSFRTEFLAKKNTPKVDYQKRNLVSNISHYNMLRKLELSFDEQFKIFQYCKKKNIGFASTPYDCKSAEFLKKLKVKFIKVSSADIVDKILHEKISKLKLPVIISTGMSSMKDIFEVLKIYKQNQFKKEIALLHCVSNYPCSNESQNLRTISKMYKKFNKTIGYSDHSNERFSSICAVSLGAKILEKHLTLSTNLNGPDHQSSLNPKQFKNYVQDIRSAEKLLGGDKKICQPEEISMKKISRKSLYLAHDLKRGDKLRFNDFVSLRPGFGISPMEIDKFLNKKLKVDVKKNTIFKKKFI
jgi:N,N'-diacetyllegionaminate synthase